jgi:hypothetical protein
MLLAGIVYSLLGILALTSWRIVKCLEWLTNWTLDNTGDKSNGDGQYLLNSNAISIIFNASLTLLNP